MSTGFSRELRLLKSTDFSFVFEQPIRIGNKAFTVLCRRNALKHPRLGMAIAKKQVKLAVDRNKIKRLIRESFRTQQSTIPSYDFIFMVRREINQMDNEKISSSLQHIWSKTRKLCAD